MIVKRPIGAGMLLGGAQMVPDELVGHLTWGAAYLGGARMSEQIASLRAAGAVDVYLWAHPDKWLASNFGDSVARAERLCSQHGLAGYIADAETPMSSALAFACGAMLKESAERGFSVGFTSFAGWAGLEHLAEGCGGAVWGACQIYNQSSDNALAFRGWFERFRSLFGTAIIIVASFVPPNGTGSQLSTPTGFDAYLGKLPYTGAHGIFGQGPSFMYARLASWRQANVVDSALWILGIPTVAHMPIVYSVIALVAIGLGLLLMFAIRRRMK